MQQQCRISGNRTRGCTRGKSNKEQTHSSTTHKTNPQDRPYTNTKIWSVAIPKRPGAYTWLEGCRNQQLVAIGAADTSGAKSQPASSTSPKKTPKEANPHKAQPTAGSKHPVRSSSSCSKIKKNPRASNSKAAAAPCEWPQMDAAHNEQA